MTTYLLDANVLIALTIKEHEHHERAGVWAAATEAFAVCPLTEGALVRFVLRIGETVATAKELVKRLRTVRGYSFWSDDLCYADAELAHVRGHRQVTDGYLAALCAARGDARMATFDRGLAVALPELVTLIPG